MIHAKLSRPTFQCSLAALLALGATATLVQVGCGSDTASQSGPGKARSALDAADCAEYGGTWSNGNCTLPGGTTTVDVPIGDDDEPIEPPFHDPPQDPPDPPECPGCGGEPPPPPPPPLPPADQQALDALKANVNKCLDVVDYNQLPATFPAAGETYTHHSGSTAWSVAGYLGQFAGFLVDTAERLRVWQEYLAFGGTASSNYLESVIARMNSKFDTAAGAGTPWQNYQKVCIAQCIASEIIAYSENALSKIGGVSTAIAQGEGVCTEFSAIAIQLIQGSAGSTVGASMGVSPGHAFVNVTFDGNTYAIEPQTNPTGGSCQFYR